jgi:hypothetical protein
MKIFIDESGRFIPGDGWSVVCALSLPHQFCGPARREIQRISKNWVKVDGEIKGSFVTVDQLAALVDCLFRYDALLHCCACDVSRHDRSAIVEHQTDQAKGITRYLVPPHHPEMVAKFVATSRGANAKPALCSVRFDARAQTRSLLDTMIQFQTFAASFASELSETRQVSSDARRRLIENLNEQYARAKFVDQLLPPTKVVTAVNYREEILKMLESVRTTSNITETSRFWSNAKQSHCGSQSTY